MPTLENFSQFEGRYWDTAAIRNALDYQGVRAPHSDRPYTEAMLLGISGGITFGYFTFHYKGYDPQVNLLTRNTFDPMQRIFDRLGVERDVVQTAQRRQGTPESRPGAGIRLRARRQPGYVAVALQCLDL